MSKMSSLAIDLDEQAGELGYNGYQEALEDGWQVDYVHRLLVKDEQEEAHKAWLEEKKKIIKQLNDLYDELVYIAIDDEYLKTVNDTIEFIKKGEV